MILNRKNVKKRTTNRNLIKWILFFAVAVCAGIGSGVSYGAPKQFQQKFSLGKDLKGTIVIVGLSDDAANIQLLFDAVVREAKDLYSRLDVSNREGEVSRINNNAGGWAIKVSWPVLEAFKSARKISEWTGGVFDIVLSGGNYRSVIIDEDESTVKLDKMGMNIDFSPIIDGYVADYIVKLIYTAKMENALVKVGKVFRGVGQSLYGPWRIEVEEDFAAAVKHSLKLTVLNSGVATVSVTEFRGRPLVDYRSKEIVPLRCKGTAIVMSDAAFAQGIAYAVFVLGPTMGYDFLNNFGLARGLIVDSQGQFLKTAGMQGGL